MRESQEFVQNKKKTGAIARCANVRGFNTNKNKMMARSRERSEKREDVR